MENERRATWLELFYDLVFAAAVAELGISLYTNYTTLASFLGTVLLFFPVCWTWIGVTFYAARFETDDVIHRVLVLLQMGGAAALALNIHGALGETSFNFAISYAVIRALLVIEYIRAAYKIPAARLFAMRYAQGFFISTTLWLISAMIPMPERFRTLDISTCDRSNNHNFNWQKACTIGTKYFLLTRANGNFYPNCTWRNNIWSY